MPGEDRRRVTLAWGAVSRAARSAQRSLRGLFPAGATPMAEYQEPGALSFLAVNDREVSRSAVLLPDALLTFDVAEFALDWSLTGLAPAEPQDLLTAREDREILRLIPLSAEIPRSQTIREMDLAGALLDGWAVVFHRDRYANGSAVHFEVASGNPVDCLVTGLAPGMWEIWRDGWAVDRVPVQPGQACLRFRSKAGMHFVRLLT